MASPTTQDLIDNQIDTGNRTGFGAVDPVHDGLETATAREAAERYRSASRRVRTLARAGTSPAELAGYVITRERAYKRLLTLGRDSLARALVEEDAFCLRLRAARDHGGDTTEPHSGYRHVHARIRILLDAEEGSTVACADTSATRP